MQTINWDSYTIGDDLHLHYEGEDPARINIAHENHLKRIMGLPKKLPVKGVDARIVGDTKVYVLSRGAAQILQPKSTRPHRMYAICNHCGKHVPTGRFGQHLGLYPLYWENPDGSRGYKGEKRTPRYAKPCKVTPDNLDQALAETKMKSPFKERRK